MKAPIIQQDGNIYMDVLEKYNSVHYDEEEIIEPVFKYWDRDKIPFLLKLNSDDTENFPEEKGG